MLYLAKDKADGCDVPYCHNHRGCVVISSFNSTVKNGFKPGLQHNVGILMNKNQIMHLATFKDMVKKNRSDESFNFTCHCITSIFFFLLDFVIFLFILLPSHPTDAKPRC